MNRKMSEIEKSAEEVLKSINHTLSKETMPNHTSVLFELVGIIAMDVRDLAAHLRSGGGALAGD